MSLASIPDSVLAMFPIATPPPGVTSNFVDPPTSGTAFIIVGGVIVPIMLVFFAIRLYSKFGILHKPTWDDLTCSIAAVGVVFYYIIVTLAITKGHLGRHAWDTSVLQSTQPWFAVPVYIINWFATLIIPFAKITFFLFYIQVFRPFRWLRILCHLGIGFTSVAFFSFLVAQLALNTPHPGETWLEVDVDPRELKSLHYLSIPITAISFAIDVYIFILPIMGVSKLKLSYRHKLGVLLVFLTGFAACVASFLTLYYKIYLNSNTTDVTWASMPVNITIMTEMSVGVTASCMPSLAKFIRHYFPDFSIIDSILSLKGLFTTRRSTTAGKPSKASSDDDSSSNSSRRDLYHKVSASDVSDKGSKLPNVYDVEMGHVRAPMGVPMGAPVPGVARADSRIDTRIDSSGLVTADKGTKGIRVQRAWQQTSQEKASSEPGQF